MESHSLSCRIIKKTIRMKVLIVKIQKMLQNLSLKGKPLFNWTKYCILNLVSGEMAVSQLLFLHTRSKKRKAATLIANGPKGMKTAFQGESNCSLLFINPFFSRPSWIALQEKLCPNCSPLFEIPPKNFQPAKTVE